MVVHNQCHELLQNALLALGTEMGVDLVSRAPDFHFKDSLTGDQRGRSDVGELDHIVIHAVPSFILRPGFVVVSAGPGP